MTKKEFSRADVLGYFTGSPGHKRDPLLQDIEKIELHKFLKAHVPEERKRNLVTLIERMCELPSYAYAKEVAREFDSGGFLARHKFTRNLHSLVELGALINPVRGVFGLSPKFLFDLELLDEFLGKAKNCVAEEVWIWVRKEIKKLELTQTELKQHGINVWK